MLINNFGLDHINLIKQVKIKNKTLLIIVHYKSKYTTIKKWIHQESI